MRLYLIRHAEAADPDPAQWPDDRGRPITPKGAGRFLLASHGLRHMAADVDCLLTSPLSRAWQTAAILTRECGWPDAVQRTELEPDRSVDAVMAFLHRRSDLFAVAVTGHEPQLSALLGRLIGAPGDASGLHFAEGAVCCLDLPEGVKPGGATMLWLLTPGILMRVRKKRSLASVGDGEDIRRAG